MNIDVLIVGGGAAGLWLLDELVRNGAKVLLVEANQLGAGQTIASQGILHGGLKYTLHGFLSSSAKQLRAMPQLWRECLAGKREPDLSQVRVRSHDCYLWRTDSAASCFGLFGARYGLRVAARELARGERPDLLSGCAGGVARVDEQVISPASLLETLARRNQRHIVKVDAHRACFELAGPGMVKSVRIGHADADTVILQPRHVVFMAGAGNAALRSSVGLSETAMQRRSLRMVLVRGELPRFNGHCVDGVSCRLTITSDVDRSGLTVWQLGGQLAEVGVALDEATCLSWARRELERAIPGIQLTGTHWTSYRIDRAERAQRQFSRPAGAQVLVEGNVVTAWPTKLALVPQLAADVLKLLGPADSADRADLAGFDRWPRPKVACPPWENCKAWQPLPGGARQSSARLPLASP